MSMTQGDIREAVNGIYRAAGLSPQQPARMLDLARAVLGPSGIQTVPPSALPSDACLVTVLGERRIFLRSGLPEERRRFVVAHELGHHALCLDSLSQQNEDTCDAFAGALIAPDEAFETALQVFGQAYRELAACFVTTESCVALRFGEVTETPMALVSPRRIRIRGAEYDWPSELELRALARARRAPGLQRARLRDDRRRVVMRAG